MKLVSKAAAFGAAAAISATGLVAATGTTANAAVGTATYTCTTPLLGTTSFAVPVTIDPSSLAGFAAPVTAGSTISHLPVKATADLTDFLTKLAADSAASGALGGIVGSGTLGATSDFPITLGGAALPLAVTGAPQTLAQLQASKTLAITGDLTKAVSAPAAAGSYPAALPKSFTLAMTADGNDLSGAGGSVSCTDANASELALGSLTVKPAPVAPFLTAKAPKTAKLHHAVKIQVTTNQTGTVVAKIKNKKVAKATVKAGKATLKVKKGLKKGANKIVVSLGSLKKTVKVKVK